jgi:hypothetical protein
LTTPSTVTADIAAELTKIRQRAEEEVRYLGLAPGDEPSPADDALRLAEGFEALLKLHGDEPIYVIASDCGHPEPEDDSSAEWEEWEESHPAGGEGAQVCVLTEDCRACPECSRLARLYDDTWISPAECSTRSAIIAALSGEEVPSEH